MPGLRQQIAYTPDKWFWVAVAGGLRTKGKFEPQPTVAQAERIQQLWVATVRVVMTLFRGETFVYKAPVPAKQPKFNLIWFILFI